MALLPKILQIALEGVFGLTWVGQMLLTRFLRATSLVCVPKFLFYSWKVKMVEAFMEIKQARGL
jgi:hypothetical protein